MKPFVPLFIATLLALPLHAEEPAPAEPHLIIAAAMSASESGLIDRLAANYLQHHPEIRIKILRVGTLQALDLGRQGRADLIISHHPQNEQLFIDQGYAKQRTLFMYSQYAIFGPAELEEEFAALKDIDQVLKHIAKEEYPFVSPAARSGTYRKLEELWSLAGIEHNWLGYENSGSSAKAALLQTPVTGSLALADMSLYYYNLEQLAPDIVPLATGASILRNHFHALVVSPERWPHSHHALAQNFLDFLVSPRGQTLIRDFSRQHYQKDLFVPAAHLDPGLQAAQLERQLAQEKSTQAWLQTLALVLVALLISTLLLGLKLRKADQRQLQVELDKQQLQMDRDLALESNRVKDEFVSVVSHELRTPLTSIIASLGMLQHLLPKTQKKEQELTELAVRNSHRLLDLINDLLDMEKLSVSDLQLQLTPLHLAEIIQQSMEELRPYCHSRQIILSRHDCEAGVQVRADAQRLLQVLTNLLSNAIKHSPEAGSIEIRCQTREGRIRVMVSDQGAGIPEGFRDQVFERFTQADASNIRKQGGTGLGLAIARAIIQLHHGEIGFYDNTPQGTVFYFELPLVSEPPAP